MTGRGKRPPRFCTGLSLSALTTVRELWLPRPWGERRGGLAQCPSSPTRCPCSCWTLPPPPPEQLAAPAEPRWAKIPTVLPADWGPPCASPISILFSPGPSQGLALNSQPDGDPRPLGQPGTHRGCQLGHLPSSPSSAPRGKRDELNFSASLPGGGREGTLRVGGRALPGARLETLPKAPYFGP